MDPIEIFYDSQESIPDVAKPLYTEIDGKWKLTGVNGLKTQADVDHVKEALRKEREDHGRAREALKPWGEMKPDEVMSQLDRIKELEAAAEGKIDDEKLNQLVEGRLAQKIGPVERNLKTISEERDALKADNDKLRTSMEARDRNEAVGGVAIDSKAHSTALEDIKMNAATMLEKDESGKWVTKSGIEGITPGLDAKSWLKEMQKLRPHWWPESEGGGALGGGSGGGFTGNNPWSTDHWNVTQQGSIFNSQGREVAERMAKSAGTKLGGTKPAKR